MKEEKK